MIPAVRNRVPGYSGMRDRLLVVRQSVLSHVHFPRINDRAVMNLFSRIMTIYGRIDYAKFIWSMNL